MKDQYTATIAQLTAEAQAVRDDRGIPSAVKHIRLDDLAVQIERLLLLRRTQHAQRVNRVSQAEQARKRY